MCLAQDQSHAYCDFQGYADLKGGSCKHNQPHILTTNQDLSNKKVEMKQEKSPSLIAQATRTVPWKVLFLRGDNRWCDIQELHLTIASYKA